MHPPFEKSPSIIDKIYLDHHEDPFSKEDPPAKEEPRMAEKEVSSPSKEQAYLISYENNNNAATQHDTPNRPTAKNKYNSTIV